MLKRGKDASREQLPVINTQRKRISWLTISVTAIDVLRWVARGGGGKI